MDTFRSDLCKEIYNFSAKFNPLLSKPHQGNLRELLMGMMLSGSSYLNHIGEVGGKGITPRKNTERYSNALRAFDTKALHKRHIEVEAFRFRDEPVLLLLDGGDIQKPHAQKMEGVGNTIDGSNGHSMGKGYPTWGVTAYGLNSKRSVPLMYHLYSTQEEHFKSEWDEQKSCCDLLKPFTKSDYDRIAIENRGGDDWKHFKYFLDDLQSSFVTRVNTGKKARGVAVNPGEEGQREVANINEVSQTMASHATSPKEYFHQKLKKKITSKIAWKAIELPQKEMKGIPLNLVFVCSDHFDEPLVLITDLKIETAQDAWKIFFYYKKRWGQEDFFRATKQEFDTESFLVRDIAAMKSLLFIQLLVVAFLRRLRQKMNEVFGVLFILFQDFCHRWQKKKEQYLDLLDWLREMFEQSRCKTDSYRYRPQKVHWRHIYLLRNQLSLFDWRKKW